MTCTSLALVKLPSEVCCQLCRFHLQKKTLTVLQYINQQLCVYLIDYFTRQIKEELGLLGTPTEEYVTAKEWIDWGFVEPESYELTNGSSYDGRKRRLIQSKKTRKTKSKITKKSIRKSVKKRKRV